VAEAAPRAGLAIFPAAREEEARGSVSRRCMDRTALITGVAGQDGSYLAEFLLARGYRVFGLARRRSEGLPPRIAHLVEGPLADTRFELVPGDVEDALGLRAILERAQPDEIYHLAAQSHVGASFEAAEATLSVTGLGAVRLLEAVRAWRRQSGRSPRYYQAGSSEMFGAAPAPQSERTPFEPRSPYGCAKVLAHHATRIQREAHGLFACNGILFNHESPRRGAEFVTRKVTRAAARIRLGLERELALGDLEVRRDWGWAPDYVEAMWLMLQQREPGDWVIATGVSHSLRDLLELAFGRLALDWREHVVLSPAFARPLDVRDLVGDASRARRELGWRPRVAFEEVVARMVDHDLELAERELAGGPVAAG
jgi:GDPmannose 4,6-dehydratase